MIVISILTNGSAADAGKQDQDPVTDLETLRIIAQEVPLSSAPAKTQGLIEPILESVVSDKDAALDLSYAGEGYIFANYTGKRDSAIVEIIYGDDKITFRYKYEVGRGWEGYALPCGSGTYRIKIVAYDEYGGKSGKDDTASFAFKVNFSDEAPYKYENSYIDYEDDSPFVSAAAYMIMEAEEKLNAPLTDREKTELIVTFVSQNIATDEELLEKLEKKETHQYFPMPDEIFASGKGVCGERAILAAAMLKSQGLTVKACHGDILMPTTGGEKEKKYHAWISVYIDGEWAMYDPSFGNTEIKDGKSRLGIEYLLDTVKPI
ncbi:MAG: transglutaminase domain-containing protein [Clostridiales Family XIII bacterium]|nr:transglutaminase domain-containing protein [Clostridiales Family XIII bacterium]